MKPFPSFLRYRKLYRHVTPLHQDSQAPVLTIDEALREVGHPDDATLVSSFSILTEDGVSVPVPCHLPVLDLDYDAHLEPSTTPGHFHLYLDHHVEHDKYMKLLDALADCGLIEWGYAKASRKRGATFVRVPGVVKGEDLSANERILGEQ
jgi:hypothetical protein